jgi:hypothetical protein
VTDKPINEEIFIRLYVHARQSGLIGELEGDMFRTLATLATYMNEKGECFPSIELLAKDMNMSSRNVKRYIDRLRKFRFKGKPVIVIETRYEGGANKRNYYKLLKNSGFAIFDGETVATLTDYEGTELSPHRDRTVTTEGTELSPSKGQNCPINYNQDNNNQSNKKKRKSKKVDKEDSNPVEVKEKRVFNPNEPLKNAGNVVEYFAYKFKEKYVVEYAANYTQEPAKVKNTILKNYGFDEVKELIDILFREYDKRWKR